MKKIITLLLCMLVGQTAFAQLVPQDDPIGTVYTFVTKTSGIEMDMKLTLLTKSDKAFTMRLDQSIPQVGDITYETEVKVEKEYMYSPLEEMKKTSTAPIEKMGMKIDKFEITGEPTRTPLVGKVGQEFPLNEIKMVMGMMGMTTTTTTKVTSNKVLREETITTPAGKFDTFVTETVTVTEVEAMGQNQTQVMTTLSWIVPGRGAVKTIQKDATGAEIVVELKEIKRP